VRRATVTAVVAASALVLLAAGVQLSAPDDDTQQAAFSQRVAIGQQGTGRNVAATVTRVRLARSIHSLEWDGTTTGVWVVVQLKMSTVLTATGPDAVLRIGGVDYDASDRPGSEALNSLTLQPGLPYSGALLFEVPRSAVASLAARQAIVRVFVARDPALDSSIEFTSDLRDADIRSSVTLEAPVRSTG
jgi:hypothetical protein